MISLNQLVADVAEAIVALDRSAVPHKGFRPGAGPYGEPQLVQAIARWMKEGRDYGLSVHTKRTPDLLIASQWAIEFKIVRPFGDNGLPAEDWSVNLLHPYPGNQSSIGDCLKLQSLGTPEHKSVIVAAYEHEPARVSLDPLLQSFELIATAVVGIRLSERVEAARGGLIHPAHQRLRVFGWEIIQ